MFKTGTSSLRAYFKNLGFNVNDGFQEFQIINPEHENLFQFEKIRDIILTTHKKELINLIEKYDVLGDFPFMFIYEWLHKNYPNSKFIFTTRNPAEAARSDLLMWCRNGINQKYEEKYEKIIQLEKFQERLIQHQKNVQNFFREKKNLFCVDVQDIVLDEKKVCRKLQNFVGFENLIEKVQFPHQNKGAYLKIGVLIPIRSKDRSEFEILQIIANMYEMLRSDSVADFQILIGYDDDDQVLKNVQKICQNQEDKNTQSKFEFEFLELKSEVPFPACRVWDKMGQHAFDALGCNAVVFLGDDIQILREDWFRKVYSKFWQIHENKNVPFGVGCVVMKEKIAPSWPSFPVLCKNHFQIFGKIIPNEFINQEADPFLFEIYRKFGLAEFTEEFLVENQFGGVRGGLLPPLKPMRYQPQFFNFKKDDSVFILWKHILSSNFPFLAQKITIDVTTPSFRLNRSFFENVQKIQIPDDVDLRFIWVIDQPVQKSSKEFKFLREMELKDNKIRIRLNKENTGAIKSRQRALNECYSEYVLFLDDDVQPQRDIIIEYSKKIKQFADAKGFVGLSRVPFDGRQFTNAVHLAETTYFWHIAEHPLKNSIVPWGVTANLMIKYDKDAKFDPRFPKSGGGEDVDLCLLLGGAHGKFYAVPKAIVIHPWWGNRFQVWKRLYKWAIGDGMLIDKHPQHSYIAFPNFWEMSLILFILFIICLINPLYRIKLEIILFVLGFFPLLFIGEVAVGTFLVYWTRKFKLIPQESIPRRFFVGLVQAIESTFVRNASELGHFCGQIQRRKFCNLLKRFDWFGGTYPNGPVEEVKRSALFVVVWFVLWVMWAIYFWIFR